ncbi:MAG: ABC transporter permease [Bryobacterales bacterium]|nr:ABC transporter permease [Acidobacteriota bacterium]MCB9383077.1 ABC transporter permease [Bryobacterales bacterium]
MSAGAARRTETVEAFRFALAALWQHKTRSLLTGLSMLIANASVITVVSIALAGRDFVVSQIEGVGSNLIYAYYEAGGNVSGSEADYIDLSDVDAVKARLGPLAAAVSGVMSTWDYAPIEGRAEQIRVLGANADYEQVRNIRVLAGRFFDQSEIDERKKVTLLTAPLAKKLFRSVGNTAGQSLKIHGLDFRVIGVFEEGVDTFGQSEVSSNSALIPITVMQYFAPVERVDPLYISVRSGEEVPRASELVRETLEARHRPGSLYRVDSLTGVLEAARQISAALTVVLLLVAAITLGISGIFIMNIMLIAVAERTKEIGLRMAVGATRRQVKTQFLMEAVAISLIGGLAGVLVGVSIPLALNVLIPRLDVPQIANLVIPISPWSIAAAILVSGTVGAVFGLMPAARAAQLDPVEALRHE